MASMDRAALEALYRSTGGAAWKENRNWNTDAALFRWHGVLVDGDGRVMMLHLNDNNLQGSIPTELGVLSKLEELFLSDNKLAGPIPKKLGELAELKKLILYNNGLTGSIPEGLGALGKLEEFLLYGNKLSGPIPRELGRMTALKRLEVNGNGLTGLIPEELGGLSMLETLRLDDNKLSGPIPKELGELAALKQLGLNNNGLTGPIPEELGALGKLEKFLLYGNKLSGPIPRELGKMTALKRLEVNGNGLTGSIPEELGGLSMLETLRLDDNKLSGLIPKELGTLTALKKLNVSKNGLTGSIPEELGALGMLETLFLSDNKLAGPIPKELGELAELKVLALYNNGLTGPIPRELGKMTALKRLSVNGNGLTGSIPAELGVLSNLEELWLENNKLGGSIPEELGGLSKLETLRLAGNNLSGGVPRSIRKLPNRKPGGFVFHIAEDGAPVPPYKSWKTIAVPLVLGYADLATDVYAVVSYYKAHHMWWFAIGLVFLVGPALLTAAFVFRREDWLTRAFVALQLGLLVEGLVSWGGSTYSHVLVTLRVVEPLYESVPQLMLQMYVLLLEWNSGSLLRLMSIVVSCLSLAYASTGLVAEQPLSQRSPDDDNVSSARCTGLTEFFFGTVPTSGSVRVCGSTWHPQNFVWAFLLYQGLEIGSRFISLALLALVLRSYFFLVLLWLWVSRSLVLRHSLGAGEEQLWFRSQLRLVGMPFMDSVMDALKSYDAGCALTTAEFVVCLAVSLRFSPKDAGQVPYSVRLVWICVAAVCMVGKLVLGYLIVRPFKKTVGFGFGDQQVGQTSGSHNLTAGDGGNSAGDGGSRDAESAGSRRGSGGGLVGGEQSRVDADNESIRELTGPESRRSARVHEATPVSSGAGQRGKPPSAVGEDTEEASRVGSLDRLGEADGAESVAGLQMTGMEEGKVGHGVAPSE